jgi:hypothetical protein
MPVASQPDDDQHTIDQYYDHTAAISDALRRCQSGALSTYGKRKAIATENQRYYGPKRKSPVTGETLTAVAPTPDVASVLCDATGVPHQSMSAALKALRTAYATARAAIDDGATNEAAATIRAGGWAEFRDQAGTTARPAGLFDPDTLL